jgi:hypothetical protein
MAGNNKAGVVREISIRGIISLQIFPDSGSTSVTEVGKAGRLAGATSSPAVSSRNSPRRFIALSIRSAPPTNV